MRPFRYLHALERIKARTEHFKRVRDPHKCWNIAGAGRIGPVVPCPWPSRCKTSECSWLVGSPVLKWSHGKTSESEILVGFGAHRLMPTATQIVQKFHKGREEKIDM